MTDTLTATQITAEMRRLASLLPTALADFEGDRALVLRDLSETIACTSTSVDVLGDQADNSDGPGWDTVAYECGRANHLLGAVSTSLKVASKAAQGEQDATASLIDRAFSGGRGSRFFDTLANLPGSAQLAV